MKNFIALIVLSLAAGMAFANTINEIPFAPMGPEVLGRGGSAIADTRGYDSLFYNPAGFSRDPSTFTLSSTTAWVYSRPDQLLGLAGQTASGTSSPTSVLSFLNNQVTRGESGRAPPGALDMSAGVLASGPRLSWILS